MDILSALPIIVATLAATSTIYLIVKLFGAPLVQGRFSSIDGLRGYLAFFVYLHHSCIWYFYIRTGRWENTSSNLYNHLGQSSVALFFMITGFLFFSKLIDARTKGIDWGRLFISRFMRLVPLYLFAMCSLFIIVCVLSDGILNEPLSILLQKIIQWLGFESPLHF